MDPFGMMISAVIAIFAGRWLLNRDTEEASEDREHFRQLLKEAEGHAGTAYLWARRQYLDSIRPQLMKFGWLVIGVLAVCMGQSVLSAMEPSAHVLGRLSIAGASLAGILWIAFAMGLRNRELPNAASAPAPETPVETADAPASTPAMPTSPPQQDGYSAFIMLGRSAVTLFVIGNMYVVGAILGDSRVSAMWGTVLVILAVLIPYGILTILAVMGVKLVDVSEGAANGFRKMLQVTLKALNKRGIEEFIKERWDFAKQESFRPWVNDIMLTTGAQLAPFYIYAILFRSVWIQSCLVTAQLIGFGILLMFMRRKGQEDTVEGMKLRAVYVHSAVAVVGLVLLVLTSISPTFDTLLRSRANDALGLFQDLLAGNAASWKTGLIALAIGSTVCLLVYPTDKDASLKLVRQAVAAPFGLMALVGLIMFCVAIFSKTAPAVAAEQNVSAKPAGQAVPAAKLAASATTASADKASVNLSLITVVKVEASAKPLSSTSPFSAKNPVKPAPVKKDQVDKDFDRVCAKYGCDD